MASAQRLKQRLLIEIDRLPENELGEVLDFVSFLLSKQQSAPQESVDPMLQTTLHGDPLQAFIGGVAHASLAQQIDEDLYGA
ncbi:MAG TPA: DUF2281 domain-containing protein [Herpetosiphonaceae bacterium]